MSKELMEDEGNHQKERDVGVHVGVAGVVGSGVTVSVGLGVAEGATTGGATMTVVSIAVIAGSPSPLTWTVFVIAPRTLDQVRTCRVRVMALPGAKSPGWPDQ